MDLMIVNNVIKKPSYIDTNQDEIIDPKCYKNLEVGNL